VRDEAIVTAQHQLGLVPPTVRVNLSPQRRLKPRVGVELIDAKMPRDCLCYSVVKVG
jgi:hypothetical protein